MGTDDGFKPIRGWLCADHPVTLHPETAEIGGSFQARVDREDSGISEPLAWDNGLVLFFHEQLCKFEREHEGLYLFVDAGASTGSFSLLAHYHLKMLVYAYEPNARPHRILKANVALNGLEGRVSVFDFALGEMAGRVRLQIPKNPKWLAVATTARSETLRKRGLEWTKNAGRATDDPGLLVTMVRLDQVVLPFGVDFMKVDVEGAELMVLRGAQNILERDHPKLLVEFQELNTRQFGYEPQEIIEFLKELGYTQFRRVGVEDLWAEA